MSDFLRELSLVTARNAARDVDLVLCTLQEVVRKLAELPRMTLGGGYSMRSAARAEILARNARELCGEAGKIVEQLRHRTREVLDAMTEEAADAVER